MWASLYKSIINRVVNWVPGFLLKLFYSEQKLRNGIHVYAVASNSRFEIKAEKLTPALILELGVCNFLPFSVEIQVTSLCLNADGKEWLEQSFNQDMKIRPSSWGTILLHEIGLNSRIVENLKKINNRALLIRCAVDFKIQTKVRKFSLKKDIEARTSINF